MRRRETIVAGTGLFDYSNFQVLSYSTLSSVAFIWWFKNYHIGLSVGWCAFEIIGPHSKKKSVHRRRVVFTVYVVNKILPNLHCSM